MAASAQKNRRVEHCTCAHAGGPVTLVTEVARPADLLPDSPPRILARNCSHYCDCHLQNKAECSYAVSPPPGR